MSSSTNNNIKLASQPNKKTRLCKNALTCAFGDRCHYAHKLCELKIANCAYGKDCIFILNGPEGYINKKNIKLCHFRHPDESDMDYNIRVGNTLIKTPPTRVNSQEPPHPESEKDSPLEPIKLVFDEEYPNSWITVAKKGQSNTYDDPVSIVVNESDAVRVVGELMDKGVIRILLKINY